MTGRPHPQDPLAATDEWFARHGLTYFVPEHRSAVRAALHPRRAVPRAVGVLLVAGAAGVALAWLSRDPGTAPALLLTIGALSALAYGVTALRAGPILRWALRRAFGSLPRLLPMIFRALPLLLLFMTFLFINAEVWEMSASVSIGALWLTVLLFGGLATAFLLVRLPEEVDKVDDHVDAGFVTRACRGTPLEGECRDLVADPDADLTTYAAVTGLERWNLILALLVIQLVQVLLIALGVFVFFLVFGALVMTDGVQMGWTGQESLHSLDWLPNVSGELLRVSLFLAAFGALYLTVSAVVDETYREQFFGDVLRELERAVGVRAVYRTLRAARPAA